MRTRILDHLHTSPGESTRGVARAMEIDESTADYHLRRLEKERRVARERCGREMTWFPTGAGYCPVLRRAMPAFRRGGVAPLAQALDDRPRSAADLARRAGLEMGKTRWATRLLAEAGLLDRARDGRVRLREGAAICVAKCLLREGCDRWGKCAMSQARPSPPDPLPRGAWHGEGWSRPRA